MWRFAKEVDEGDLTVVPVFALPKSQGQPAPQVSPNPSLGHLSPPLWTGNSETKVTTKTERPTQALERPKTAFLALRGRFDNQTQPTDFAEKAFFGGGTRNGWFLRPPPDCECPLPGLRLVLPTDFVQQRFAGTSVLQEGRGKKLSSTDPTKVVSTPTDKLNRSEAGQWVYQQMAVRDQDRFPISGDQHPVYDGGDSVHPGPNDRTRRQETLYLKPPETPRSDYHISDIRWFGPRGALH